jgi:hypothetical protein
MSEFSLVVVLEASHDRSQFDCGVEPLNVYLEQYALQNQKITSSLTPITPVWER